MVTRYIVVHWQFDLERFSRHIKAWCEAVGYDTVAMAIGVSKPTVTRWANGGYGGVHDHPNMDNFIKACDELSLDPRDFFTTSE